MRMNVLKAAGTAAVFLLLTASGTAAEIGQRSPKNEVRLPEPVVAPASSEGLDNMKTFQIPEGFQIELVAAEPLLANPVAFAIDWKGRFLISETQRYRSSVLDIRHYMFMLEDDLALRRVDDRIAMVKKHFGDKADELVIESEVVRLIEDTNGDHKADKSTVFATGFNTMLDGIASGVLARKDRVYFTNIPNLWELRDLDNDGRADLRRSLSRGYGVRFSYTGHDMHGLVIGPDGKLYFSFGDRGANVRTQEGGKLEFPDEGAVFRCNLDGSGLEVVHSGLRNPQELAFDDFGNLFTGDNDCDNGDSERWVQIVEGGESGWRVGYQHALLGKAGQWMSEELWKPRFPGQAAYILPPIANLFDGPSGLTSNPGTGFPAKYAGCFFLTQFKGQASISGISAIRLEPKGASFEMKSLEKFVWNCLPTDVDFGYDGSMYFSDWHHNWPKSSRGRIYRLYDPQAVQLEPVREVTRLFAEGFDQRPLGELEELLAHEDRRVRQEAQFAIVDKALADRTRPDRAALASLLRAAKAGPSLLARLHGIWGVGQVAVWHSREARAIAGLLADKEAEVRAQTAKVLGDAGHGKSMKALIKCLDDKSARVRFFAAQSLGKLENRKAVAPLFEMLRANADQDLYLRHAGVIALTRIGDTESVAEAAADPDASVRLAALLVMRRTKDPRIAAFLNDDDPLFVLEAARAINDVPIEAAFPQLAAMAFDTARLASIRPAADVMIDLQKPLALRIVNAGFRLGDQASADRLAAYAADNGTLEAGRTEALHALATWATPHRRDRIVGVYRPLPERDDSIAAEALESTLQSILDNAPETVRVAALDAAAALGVRSAAGDILRIVLDSQASPRIRAASLDALNRLDPARLGVAVEKAATDSSELLRSKAVSLLGALGHDKAMNALKHILANGSVAEKQNAFGTLATMKGAEATGLIREWLDRLLSGKAAPALHLDILEAAAKLRDPSLEKKLSAYAASLPKDDEVAPFKDALHGGDAAAGRRIFEEKIEVACIRCHKFQGKGGDVGPAIDSFGPKHTREYLLESVVAPSRTIAEGFASVSVETRDGDEFSGVVKKETDKELQLALADGTIAKIDKARITLRQTSSLSGMPPGMGLLLSKRELRDLIEFLAIRK